jgi:hypothetical protein
MKISVDIDTEQVVKLTAAVLRQLPYATNSAITRTAKEAVDAGQKEVAASLTIRKRFILNRIKILQYSRVSNLTAIVGIDTKVQGSPLILSFLEEGGEKQPQLGSEIAVPLTGEAARPTFQDLIPGSLKYKALRIDQLKGRQRTYVIPNVGVFQRIAKGDSPSATVLIYSFKSSARLPQHIAVRAAFLKVIGERFDAIFTEEFVKEILKKAHR